MQISKTQTATGLAILFHVVGLILVFTLGPSTLLAATPFHLLLMTALLLYTQGKINTRFVIFFAVCFLTGLIVEVVGTSTAAFFGNYFYGNLGLSVKNVPLVIGLNWFIIVYCCGVAMSIATERLSAKLAARTGRTVSIGFISFITDGALLAAAFDWIMEPAAIKLGYWHWLGNGRPPLYNYTCWFVVTAGLLALFRVLKFPTRNIFAVNLLLIMLMFFMLIRTFL